jgi:hypothetical protein
MLLISERFMALAKAICLHFKFDPNLYRLTQNTKFIRSNLTPVLSDLALVCSLFFLKYFDI